MLKEAGLDAFEDLVADKGYHTRARLKDLDGGLRLKQPYRAMALQEGRWRSRIAEPKPKGGVQRWQDDVEAQRAVYGNRARLRSGVAKEARGS